MITTVAWASGHDVKIVEFVAIPFLVLLVVVLGVAGVVAWLARRK